MTDILIWWTNQADCEAIMEAAGNGPMLPKGYPVYLRDQFSSRYGRNGRGRLWTAPHFGTVAVDPWPTTALARVLGEAYGGIVIHAEDARYLDEFPGVVTDLRLRRYRG